MIIVTEVKKHKKSVFSYQEVDDNDVLEEKTINVKIVNSMYKGKKRRCLYNTKNEIIEDAYNFINHPDKIVAANTIDYQLRALQYLYIFGEIINKDPKEFNSKDFTRLQYFLSGISNSASDFEFNLLTKRSNKTVAMYMSAYRVFLDYLGLNNSVVTSKSTISNSIFVRNNRNAPGHAVEVPKFISVDEYKKIIYHIRSREAKSSLQKEYKLRDEAICRLMFEGGLRLGEVLGLTMEDVTLEERSDGSNIGIIYIRNRFTDKPYQNAKTCMNIVNRHQYNSHEYTVFMAGYQKTFISEDLYDLICEYVDVSNSHADKKNKKKFISRKADSVGEYKKANKENYYLFLNNRGEPLSDEGWNKNLRKIFKAVGIIVDNEKRQNNLSHRFRHGFIMHLIYDLHIQREMVQKRARHESYASLDAYYNPTTEQLMEHFNAIEQDILGDEVIVQV